MSSGTTVGINAASSTSLSFAVTVSACQPRFRKRQGRTSWMSPAAALERNNSDWRDSNGSYRDCGAISMQHRHHLYFGLIQYNDIPTVPQAQTYDLQRNAVWPTQSASVVECVSPLH